MNRRITVEDFKTAEAFTKAADLIHRLELTAAADTGVALALNDAKCYLRQRAMENLDEAENAAAPEPEDTGAAQSDLTSPRPSAQRLA